MTALSEGNGLNYRSYLGINPNSQLTRSISSDSTDAVVDIVKCENINTSHVPPVVDANQNNNEDSAPVLDIVINNVVCSFNLRCHLNLKFIALNGVNVEYRRENGMVTMKLRSPSATASIWSSGKITCTGATSDADAKKAARRFARKIQQLGFKVKFANFRIVNVLGTCTMPFAIKISQFSAHHRQNASYEPELHPGVTFKIKEIKATLKIFSTGSITITAPSVENVQSAVEYIFPLVYEFRKERPPQVKEIINQRKFLKPDFAHINEESCDSLTIDDDEEMDMKDSDASWD